MFNPERLLGGLLQGGMRRKRGGLGSLVSGGMALGLVGVAWEAVEHYMNKSQGAAAGPPPMAPPIGGPGPSGASAAPPPPPGTTPGAPPPPLPGATAGSPPAGMTGGQTDAVLLIQAMIAAANADGTIDAQERANILDRLKNVQLSEAENQFIAHELLAPKTHKDIVAAVNSVDMARQVYLVSVLAIEVDTDEELDYLRNLAQGLNLDQDTLQTLHQQAGVEVIF